MALVWVLLGILVLGGVAVVASGRGDGLPPAEPDRPDVALPPDGPLARSDVDQVRFSVGLRGYRMDEVDDILDRLALDLDARDERIAVLEREVGSAPSEPAGEPLPEPQRDSEPEPEPESEPEPEPEPEPEDAAGADEDLQVGRTMIVPFQQTDRRFAPPESSDDDPPSSPSAPSAPGG